MRKANASKNQSPIPKKYARKKGQTVENWLIEQLWIAYLDARKCKRHTKDEFRMELNPIENIRVLVKDILERCYNPSRGIAFIVHDPVIREIFAAPFRDRIIHHFLYNMCAEWWDRRLIYDSYSCRPNKGVLLGAERLRKKMNQAKRKYPGEKIWIVKMDVRGYFMSLPRMGLFERIDWGLERQFNGERPPEYYIIRFLWQMVIFDDPTEGVQKRGNLREWELLPDSKSLFHQPKGKGIVIGNLSSQLLSNIYLDMADRFITQTLGYEYYGRYVDDFYILFPESQKEQVLRDVEAIRTFLLGHELTLHPKKFYMQEIDKGVTFLGMRVYPNRILPGQRIVDRYYAAAHDVCSGLKEPEVLVSYSGHFSHLKGAKIENQIFESVGWDLE